MNNSIQCKAVFVIWSISALLFFLYVNPRIQVEEIATPTLDGVSLLEDQQNSPPTQPPIPDKFGWFDRKADLLWSNKRFIYENAKDQLLSVPLGMETRDNEIDSAQKISEDMFKFSNLWAVSFGRFDGDAYLDMLAVDLNTGNPLIFWNNPNGSFVQLVNAFFPTSPFYVSDSLNITSSLWGDYNDDKFDDLVISTSIGIFIFENSRSLEPTSLESYKTRVLSLRQHITIKDGACAGDLSWISVDPKKLNLVVACVDENKQYVYPLLEFEYDGEKKFNPLIKTIAPTITQKHDTNFVLVETTSLAIQESPSTVLYTHARFLIGNKMVAPSFDLGYSPGENQINILSDVFENLYIVSCSLGVPIYNDSEVQEKCAPAQILWSDVIFLGKPIKDNLPKQKNIWTIWTGFTFISKSSTLGDINSDGRVDTFIYGVLYDTSGKIVASVLLVLIKKDAELVYIPAILVVREYDEQRNIVGLGKQDGKIEDCNCEGPDCLIHLSVVLGDFDNDMDLDVIVLDNYRGERECTIMSLMVNDGNANLVHFSNLVVPPLTQRNRGELIPLTMKHSIGDWPRSRPSIIVVDYNNDGALDLLIEISGHVIIFESSLYSVNGVAKANWVDVFVVSTSETPGAIGKIVKLKTKSGMKIFREVYGNSRGSARLHFGLGSNKVAENLKVLTDVDHVGIYGYRNIEGGQTLYLADILRVEYKNKAALELISSNPIRLDECGESNKVRLEPEFMIIGFWKCGTTGLHEYLTEHPQILAPNVKELIYFSIWQNMYPSTLNTYKAQFPCGVKDYHLTFESTPSYVVVPYVAARLRNTFPELKKFILCVRDPIDRAYSYFQMMTRTETAKLWVLYLHMECVLSKSKDKNFQNAFKKNVCHNQHTYDPKTTEFPFMFDVIIRAQLFMLEHCLNANGDDMDAAIFECPSLNSQILTSSLYYYHYSHWLKFYPKESFLIVNYADLLDHYKFPPTMLKIVKFLSIEPHTWEPPPPSVVSKYSSMWESTRKLLRNFFYEHNKKFYKLAGVDYGW
eukprot:TRINITY_DN1052_c0_g2_i2.p1 TRINITY_DN1052_c0_g2~~TRINITY_DN1052_c0_g2_i2.p1  ORF type:complete len:1028 (-),score=193.94 TRINITY_DN1052_c0_g2_i2:30-3113(-)